MVTRSFPNRGGRYLGVLLNILVVLSLVLSLAGPAALSTAAAQAAPPGTPAAPPPTPSATATATATPTGTPSPTPATTPTGTLTTTPLPTVATLTVTPTVTQTPTLTLIPTPPPTITPTATPTEPVDAGWALILPGRGGLLASPDGRLQVDFPPGAVDQPVEARFQGLKPLDLAPGRRLLYHFDLSAWPADRPDLPPPAFLEPVALTVTYTLTDVQGMIPDSLRLVTWDEAQAAWMPISATLDVTNSRLTANLAHFSGYGIEGEQDDTFFTPHIEAGQVSLFSGDSAFSYELDVPAGAGGLKVPLTLRYSGGTANGMAGSTDTDGGWVGAGWTLDLGSIELQHEKDRDYYFLTLNGVAEKLAMDVEGAEVNCLDAQWGAWNCKTSTSTYRTEQESFFKISRIARKLTHPYGCWDGETPLRALVEHDAYWQIRDPGGTLYELGKDDYTDMAPPPDPPGNWTWPTAANQQGASDRAFTNRKLDGPANRKLDYQRFYLSRIVDTHGNTVEIDYASFSSTRENTSGNCPVFDDYRWTWKEAYPAAIRYTTNPTQGDNRAEYVVEFTVADKPFTDVHDDQYLAQSAKRLTGVKVKYHPASGSDIVIREYRFSYSAGGPPLLLTGIIEYGQGGWPNNPLPGIQFGYTSGMIAAGGVEFTRQFLNNVTTGYHGTLSFSYAPWCYPESERGQDCAGDVSDFAKQRVQTKTVNPGAGTASAYTYTYTDPGMKKSDKEPYTHSLVGFGQVDEVVGGRRTVTHFDNTTEGGNPESGDPDDPYKGKTPKTQAMDAAGTVTYTIALTSYDDARQDSWPDRVHYIYPFEVIDRTCDGTADCQTGQSKMTRTYYDTKWQNCGNGGTQPQYGNVTRIEEYDSESAQTPYRTKLTGYCPNTTAWIINKPAFENLYSGGIVPDSPNPSQLQSSTWYIYSDEENNPAANWNQTAGSKGELRGVRRMLQWTPSFQLADTRYWHDAFGNVEIETVYNSYGAGNTWASASPRSTTTTYDSQKVFPVSVTQPAVDDQSLQETREYYEINESDPSNGAGLPGQLKRVRDVKNQDETLYQYDANGRPAYTWRPYDDPPWDVNSAGTAVEYEAPIDSPTWKHTRQRDGAGGDGYLHTWSFYDGLGRLIQSQAESEEAGNLVVTSRAYNALGQVEKESLPYELTATGGSYAAPTWNSLAHITTAYDVLGRTTLVTNPDQTATTTAYHGWQEAAIDAEQHLKVYDKDAFGRLVEVHEYLGLHSTPVWDGSGAYATTGYAYDKLDNLTDVWDAAGNHSQMWYDMLGRKTAMDDPDMGDWSYTYDAVGNLTGQDDPNSPPVIFTYDALNRLTCKDYPTGDDVYYKYDDCNLDGLAKNSWGRLRATFVGGGGDVSQSENRRWYGYDDRGRMI